MMRFMLPIFLSMLFYNCSNKARESVILTNSFFMNPDEPRFGIEIKGDTLFYCEETIENPGHYNYYYCIYDISKIQTLQQEIKLAFDSVYDYGEVYDATWSELVIIKGNDSIITRFYLEMLEENQREVIDNLIELRNCKLNKIEYHRFPENLQKSKLPEPPPVSEWKVKD